MSFRFLSLTAGFFRNAYYFFPGKAAELKCLAYIGFGEDPDIVMYWTVDGKFVEEYEGLVESWK